MPPSSLLQAKQSRGGPNTSLALRYAPGPAAEALLANTGHVLGVIGYGGARPPILAPDVPFLAAPLAPVTGGKHYEIWTAAAPVVPLRAGPVAGACSDGLAFGAVRLDEMAGGLEAAVERAYLAIFDFLAQSGCTQPLRFWNYLTAILDDDQGLERYRRFNIGRHRAFMARLTQKLPPAASCVGGHGAASVIYFLAAREAALPVENPRQVSAYDYPPQYGPRSPSFSRAGLFAGNLFISGTASIVGHESRHGGDVLRQLDETLTNLRALAGNAGVAADFAKSADWAFKIYLREGQDQARIAPLLDAAFGPQSQKLYLHGEICRPDLLLEIEAFHAAEKKGQGSALDPR